MAITTPIKLAQFHRVVGAAASRDAFAVAASSRSYKMVSHQECSSRRGYCWKRFAFSTLLFGSGSPGLE